MYIYVQYFLQSQDLDKKDTGPFRRTQLEAMVLVSFSVNYIYEFIVKLLFFPFKMNDI